MRAFRDAGDGEVGFRDPDGGGGVGGDGDAQGEGVRVALLVGGDAAADGLGGGGDVGEIAEDVRLDGEVGDSGMVVVWYDARQR